MRKQKKLALFTILLFVLIGIIILVSIPLSKQVLERGLFSSTSSSNTTPITSSTAQEALLGEINTQYYWKSVNTDPALVYQGAIHSESKDACNTLPKEVQERCITQQTLLQLQKSKNTSINQCNTIKNEQEKILCQEYLSTEQALNKNDITQCATLKNKKNCEIEVIRQAFFLTPDNTPDLCAPTRDSDRMTLCQTVREEIAPALAETKKQRIHSLNQTTEIIASGDYHRCIETNSALGMSGYCQIKILEKEVTEKRITKAEACSLLDNTTPLPVLTDTQTYKVETLPLREACEKLIKE